MKKSTLKTEWDLTLLYKSISDPQIDADVQAIEKACADFSKKYSKNNTYTTDKVLLLKALKDYEKTLAIVGSSKPYSYPALMRDVDSANTKAQAKMNQVLNEVTKSMNNMVFFPLALGKIDTSIQKSVNADSNFKKYNYFLNSLWKKAKYQLSEDVEKVLALKSMPAHQMWVDTQAKLLSLQTIPYKKKQITLSMASVLIPELPKQERIALHKLVRAKLKEISFLAEAELNAIVADKKISDDLRGLTKPYSATILEFQNDEKTIESLVKAVTNNFPIAHRYLKLRAKVLGYKKLHPTDMGVPIGKIKSKFTYEKSVAIIRNTLSKISPQYEQIFNDFVTDGRIDVYSKKGKRDGGYCWSGYNIPTYILLNWSESMRSITTLGHEMGHAIHGELSKTQPILYKSHTTSVAEVASTLFENFIFDEVIKELPEKEKIIAIFDRISDAVNTIFPQVALFNFETELHNNINSTGAMSAKDMAILMNKHMSAYTGNICEFEEDDGYKFVRWSHIRYFFYTSSYAFGQLVSTALYNKYKQDPAYIEKINQFMKAGESDTPENIFKAIGIDTTKPEFFVDALKSIEQDIIELEKMVEKKKK